MIPGYLSPLLNHLWQSSLFAVVAGILTVLLRKNRAAVRYGLWLAASVKFLIPFSWLVAIGSRVEWRAAPAMAASGFSIAMEQILVPQAFAVAASSSVSVAASTRIVLSSLLVIVWALGAAAVLRSWWRQWRPIRAALSRATPLHLSFDLQSFGANVDVMSSSDLLEPGVAGIVRPVLLLPEGIADRMPAPELNAILTHECCHLRRRDNLAAAIHMLVEAIYWFLPVVRWIGARMVHERERACDEAVVRAGHAPEVYAQAILDVCEFYATSPLPCVSGVTGSDLERRIEAIMSNHTGRPLNVWKKLLLVSAVVVALSAPIAEGVFNAPLRAQSESGVADRLAFEVASVKQNKAGGPSNRDFSAGGRFTARNTSLRMLIEIAYRIQDFQLSGKQDLLNQRFDIVAKADGNRSVNDLQLMLRTLLTDRFKLAARSDTRMLPIYALVMASRDGKTGAQLRPSGADCSPITAPAGVSAPPPPPPPPGLQAPAGPDADADPHRVGHGCGGLLMPGRLSGRTMTMTQLANTLSRFLSRSVVERTGLTGNYDLDLVYTPDQMLPNGPGGPLPVPSPFSPPSDSPSVFTAIQEQLGLKLQSTKGPVRILVIEHVEPPTEN